MGAVFFYHLTRGPLEATLPALLEKATAAGWRVAVRGTSAERLNWLDQKLWMGDGFLAHGLAGGPHDADQPILLTLSAEAPNTPQCLMVVDGAEVSAEEVALLERTCVLFDGHDEAAKDDARALWRRLTGAGCAAKYWSDKSGKWAMEAESG